MMNLFQLASDNTDRLRQQLDDLLRGHEGDQDATDRMECFQEQVRVTGRIGVNMRLFVLASVFRDGAYLNTYEVANNKAAASDRALEDILREQLGDYYDKRLAFDAAFERSREFRYGSLNIGGIGAAKYGPICFIARADFATQAVRCCYVRADSLNTYVDADNELMVDALSADLATPEHRQVLSLLKHAPELHSCSADWAAMLCGELDYVEAIFVDKMGPDEAEEVRICRQTQRNLQALVAQQFTGGLNDTEKAELLDFQKLLAEVGQRSLTLTEASTC